MKKCVVISNYVVNEYRKKLLVEHIKLFKEKNIDVILASSIHIDKYEHVSNYITLTNVVEDSYITEEMFPTFDTGNIVFFKNLNSFNVNYKNYFIKSHQILLNYCKNLGYDFMYYLEFDSILKKDHIDYIIKTHIEKKVYFYKFTDGECVWANFFYGNIDVMVDKFSQKNLSLLNKESKDRLILTNEHAIYELCKCDDKIQFLNYKIDDVYHEPNIFSSNNIADVYYDHTNKQYFFLHAKGDHFKSKISSELWCDDKLIYKDTISDCGVYIYFSLENEKKYLIKVYDGDINDDNMYATYNFYTDVGVVKTKNWIEYRL